MEAVFRLGTIVAAADKLRRIREMKKPMQPADILDNIDPALVILDNIIRKTNEEVMVTCVRT